MCVCVKIISLGIKSVNFSHKLGYLNWVYVDHLLLILDNTMCIVHCTYGECPSEKNYKYIYDCILSVIF